MTATNTEQAPIDGSVAYPHLFQPLRLRQVVLRNRIVMLPMGIRFAQDGVPTEEDVAFYRARARGGVGMVITGGTPVHRNGTTRNRDLYEPFTPAALPWLRKIVSAVRAEGAVIVGQLYHRGRLGNGESDWPTMGPSPIPAGSDPQVPHEMSRVEIADMVQAFADSAATLMECGYDGIEIHAAHGYLVAQFLSPAANHRTDEYGGGESGRMRFLLELVTAIRARIGTAAVLGVRLSADEGEDVVDGIRLPYSERIGQALAATAAVDYLSITIGVRGAYVKDMSVHVGPAIPYAAAMRKASGLPVIVGQRINQPGMAESAIASGAADMVGLARALITDCDWARKAQAGLAERIRPCIGCLQVCRSGNIGCLHSPVSGRETLWPVDSWKPAANARKVVVVGGGPGGMEAAIQAAERGHRVVLFEAGKRLGGQARIAALAPNRTEVDGVVAFRELELRRLGVDVRLGHWVAAADVLAEQPDAVVLATGSTLQMADLDGADLPHVVDVCRVQEPDVPTAALLARAAQAVVVDDGSGFWESCSAAEALAQRGIKVHFVTPARMVAANLPAESIGPLIRRLRGAGVALHPLHRVSAISAASVTVFDAVAVAATRVLVETELPADVVVFYAGKKARHDLADALHGRVGELHLVGDAVAPRRINQAVLEGFRVGRSL